MQRKEAKNHQLFRVSKRVTELFAEYQGKLANEISISIGPRTSESRTSVMIEVTLTGKSNDILQSMPDTLFECWVEDPQPGPMRPQKIATAPLLVQRVTPSKIRWDYRNGKTHFYLDPDDTDRFTSLKSHHVYDNEEYATVTITFTSPNAFFSDEDIIPFYLNHLNIGMDIAPCFCDHSLIYLYFPQTIALRSRRDNSEYHSHDLGYNVELQRRVTFFKQQRHIWMWYAFGTTAADILSAPILYEFRTGLAILLAGFGLYLFRLNLITTSSSSTVSANPTIPPPLVTAFFALSFAQWFFEAFQRRHLISSSASRAITRRDWPDTITYLVFFLENIVFTLVMVALGFFYDDPVFQFNVFMLSLIVGGILLLTGGYYFVAFSFGMYLGYACDGCGSPLRVRKLENISKPWWVPAILVERVGVFIHSESRRALCFSCYRPLVNQDQPDQILPQDDWLFRQFDE